MIFFFSYDTNLKYGAKIVFLFIMRKQTDTKNIFLPKNVKQFIFK